MELELIPRLLAALVALAGLALVVDGWLADTPRRADERRRQARAERHRGGEVALGAGLLCAAAALAGVDRWRYGTVAMLVAAALVLVGALLNLRFLRERLTHRGAARRGRDGERRRLGGDALSSDAARRPHDRRLIERRHEPGTAPPRG